MPAIYVRKKGLGSKGHPPDKRPDEVFLRRSDIAKIRQAIDTEDNPHAQRDDALIYLSFFLALRAGEAAILEKRHFRHLDRNIIYVPTLKKNFKVTTVCPGCSKSMSVRWTRSGKETPCRRCGTKFVVPIDLASQIDRSPPEVALPFVEPGLRRYAQRYLDAMSNGSPWLFEGVPRGRHMSIRHIQRIFASYAAKAGLSDKYSFHSLRHGRGVDVWEGSHDRLLVRDVMRHSSLSVGERYIHLSPEMRDKYAADFEQRNLQEPI